MVAVLTAAVVLVGLLCAVDLVLTLAVIRRLRAHTLALAGMTPKRPPLPAPGTAVPAFSAVAEGGRVVSDAFFTGPTLVGVFSTTCAACHERLPEFVALARDRSAERVLAVVAGEPTDDTSLVDG